MLVRNIMTPRVITIEPDATIAQAVRLMLQHRISGLPVVDASGKLVGIVSEGDLLRRTEFGTERRRPRWLEFILGPGHLASEYVHAAGKKVREVMSETVETVTPDTGLDRVVDLMEKHRIKRLPVVEGGKLVGIVTRANLLRALATLTLESKPAPASDQKIREALLAALEQQPWAPTPSIDIVVRDGVVNLWGVIMDERQREALMVAAENTPGVKGVVDHLAWVEPHSGLVIEPDNSAVKVS